MRARVPRHISCTTVAETNAPKATTETAYQARSPSATAATPATSRAATGSRKFRSRLRREARRQAITGPIPVIARSASDSGPLTWLKNGGPTEMRCPVKASDRMGKNVPHQIANAMPSRSRLSNRNALSRLTKDSSLFSVVRRSERHQ